MPKILETMTWMRPDKVVGGFSLEVWHHEDAQHVKQQLHKRVSDLDLKTPHQLVLQLFSPSGRTVIIREGDTK